MKDKLVRCTGYNHEDCKGSDEGDYCPHRIPHTRKYLGGIPIYCTQWGFCNTVQAKVRCVRIKEKPNDPQRRKM